MNDRTTFKVYVANLGRYNEGVLQGEWVTLPMPKADLKSVLEEKLGLTLDAQQAYEAGCRGEWVYEEYAILDTDMTDGLASLDFNPSMYTNLDDLNLLAAVIQDEDVSEDELAVVGEWMSEMYAMNDLNCIKIANLVIQRDEIPFYSYDFDGIEHCSNMSNEAKLGYTCAEVSGISQKLDELNLTSYFDFEKYGHDLSYDFTLSDDGYFDMSCDGPSDDCYDREDLEEIFDAVFPDREIQALEPSSPTSIKEELNAARAASDQLAKQRSVAPERNDSRCTR